MVVRISIPGTNEFGGPKPDPVYGYQLQTQALPEVKPEADVLTVYEVLRGAYADGEPFTLQRPTYVITNLGYGAISTNLMISPLVAPAVIGDCGNWPTGRIASAMAFMER
jgi:CxxC motif-containing protein (DUF1111 family)